MAGPARVSVAATSPAHPMSHPPDARGEYRARALLPGIQGGDHARHCARRHTGDRPAARAPRTRSAALAEPLGEQTIDLAPIGLGVRLRRPLTPTGSRAPRL